MEEDKNTHIIRAQSNQLHMQWSYTHPWLARTGHADLSFYKLDGSVYKENNIKTTINCYNLKTLTIGKPNSSHSLLCTPS